MSTDATKSVSSAADGEPIQPPRGWTEVPLSSVAEIRFSGVDKLSRPSEEPVRLCNYVDVYKNDYITPDLEFMRATATTSEIDRFGLRLGDVIVTKDSETPDDIGIPTIVDYTAPDLVCGYHLALIRPNKDEVDPTFLGKQLAHHRHARRFGQLANGLTRYGLPTSAFSTAPIWQPKSLSEQKEIGRTLRLLDEAIAKAEAVITKLRQVRAGLLHDLLTRGLDKNGQLRDHATHPEQFQDSPLGRIPRDWKAKTVAEICIHIGSGVTPRGGQDVYTKTGIIFIRSQNVTFEGLLLDDIVFIPDGIHQAMLRSEVFAHDVLFNITGASIGRCCAMPAGLGKANVNQHVCILRVPNANASDAGFFASVLASSIGQKQLEALNTFGNRQGLNYQQLGSFIVPWPEKTERALVAQRISEIDVQIDAEEREYTKVSLLKSGLMNDLLNGRVRVPANKGGCA